MASPYTMTARGEALNFDQLAEASKRPVGHEETKSVVKSSRSLKKNKPINVAGFVPAAGTVTFDEAKLETSTEDTGDTDGTGEKKVAKNKRSIADMTAVRVENKNSKTKDDVDSVDDLVKGKGVMSDIMNDLNASNNAPEGYVDDVEEDAEEEVKKNTKTTSRSHSRSRKS